VTKTIPELHICLLVRVDMYQMKKYYTCVFYTYSYNVPW